MVAVALQPPPPLQPRYQSLDAWRGVAALWVAFYHLWPHEGLLAPLVNPGWRGVDLFFPISGYCIMAALQSPANATFRQFLHRRWNRIFPPYWASIVVALVFHPSVLHELRVPLWNWLAIGTLTQLLAHTSPVINGV